MGNFTRAMILAITVVIKPANFLQSLFYFIGKYKRLGYINVLAAIAMTLVFTAS